MALRSIVSVDVDDNAFKAYLTLFTKYQATLAQMPRQWAAINQATAAANAPLANLLAALGAQTQFLQQGARNAQNLNRATTSTGHSMRTLVRDTRDMARNIGSATAALLKWSSLTGVVGGLVGAGGLFGIDRLAMSAGNLRVGAARLGMQPSQFQAYNAAYGNRIPDASGFLSTINAMMQDVTQQTGFYGAGMPRSMWAGKGKNAADVAPEMLGYLRKIWIDAGPNMGQNALNARGLGQLGNQAQAMAEMSPDEFRKWQQIALDYSKKLAEINKPANLIAWQDFYSKLELAKATLQDKLITVLFEGNLPQVLGKLSEAFSNMLVDVLKSQNFKDVLGMVTTGLDKFGHWLTDTDKETADSRKAFVDGVKSIGTAAVILAKDLAWLAKKLDFVPTGDSGGGSSGTSSSAWDKLKGVVGAAVGGALGGRALGPWGMALGALAGLGIGLGGGAGSIGPDGHVIPPRDTGMPGLRRRSSNGIEIPIPPAKPGEWGYQPPAHGSWWQRVLGALNPVGSAHAGEMPGFRAAHAGAPGPGDPRGMTEVLRAAAVANHLNPDDVVGVARAEGLSTKKYATWDVNDWSYGALQMHKGGLATEYQRATGKDPADPANEADMDTWAVQYAAKHGWRKWSSVRFGRARTPRVTGPGVSATGSGGNNYSPAWLSDPERSGDFRVGLDANKQAAARRKFAQAVQGIPSGGTYDKTGDHLPNMPNMPWRSMGGAAPSATPAARVEIHNETGSSVATTVDQLAM